MAIRHLIHKQFYHLNTSKQVLTNEQIQQHTATTQITRFMGPTWGPRESCRPLMGPTLVPWTLLSGYNPSLQSVISTKMLILGMLHSGTERPSRRPFMTTCILYVLLPATGWHRLIQPSHNISHARIKATMFGVLGYKQFTIRFCSPRFVWLYWQVCLDFSVT